MVISEQLYKDTILANELDLKPYVGLDLVVCGNGEVVRIYKKMVLN